MPKEIPAQNIICLKLLKRQSEAIKVFDFVRAKSCAIGHCYSKTATKHFESVEIPSSKQPWIFQLHFCAN
jgi:hypothetical protein